ncbi:transposase [Streptomyces sp. NPDC050636]|uniref:transposase n=1 Tax=Streptomyces sp. NPDC050636 TaxID=3154510 RepID=UPI0034409BE6
MSVAAGIVGRLVPDELSVLYQRVVPEAPSRRQGGGKRRHGDREVPVAVVFVTTSGCTWQQLPSGGFVHEKRVLAQLLWTRTPSDG